MTFNKDKCISVNLTTKDGITNKKESMMTVSMQKDAVRNSVHVPRSYSEISGAVNAMRKHNWGHGNISPEHKPTVTNFNLH
jgi:hypothetical protein